MKNNKVINEGTLTTPLGTIKLVTNSKKNEDVVLYGNRSANSNYQFLSFYNPVYFYLISKKKISSSDIKSISTSFIKRKLIQKMHSNKNKDPESSIKIVIPDYFENCADLKKELSHITSNNFECINISEFTEKIVKTGKPFEAFISPLTPGMPGKDAIHKQYFDKKSKDNWLGVKNTKTNVYLLGSSEGIIQVKKNKICSVRPNSLGLSDITFDDFVECNN
jgi:hypothetical protein